MMLIGVLGLAALVLLAGSASAQGPGDIVIAEGCNDDAVTPEVLARGFFNGFDPATGTVVAQHTFSRATANNGLSPESNPAVCAPLTSPCTLGFIITRFSNNTITGQPVTNVFVGPSPECNLNVCQGSVTTLDPATQTLNGLFFTRGTNDATFPVTATQWQLDTSAPMQLAFKVAVGGGLSCEVIFDAPSTQWIDDIFGALPAPTAPEATVGDCVTIGNSTVLDGPAKKSFGRCQWQCLTHPGCSSMTFDGVAITRADLPTTDGTAFGDPYFTTDASPGLCVMFGADGTIIDTQEQSCEECKHQCDTWTQCVSFTHNYVADVCTP